MINKRLLVFLAAAFVPIVVLGLLYPHRTPEANGGVDASTEGADMVAFTNEDCPHCAEFEDFATQKGWEVEYLEIRLIKNQQLFTKLQERAPTLQRAVPTIYINGRVVQGYKDNESTGAMLDLLLTNCQSSKDGCTPFREFLETDQHVIVETAEGVCTEGCEVDLDKYVFNLPILGEVDLTLLSLPALSILLGFLDGFNPCAMWVLITLLTLLINTRDMKKIWIIGGTFLFVSGAVYYFFIAAWLNAFLLVGYNVWLQKIIGLVAVGAGGFYLYEALGKDPNACSVTNLKQKHQIQERMQKILHFSAWPAMVIGVAILAVSVNTIELVCTAGLPAVFTQILAFNDLSTFARYGYMLLFIIMYMIDDVVIFAIAVYTLHATGLTKKYARFTLIFGGVLMYLLGALLIFAPELLTFS